MMATGILQNSSDLLEMKWGPMVMVSILFHLAVFSTILFVPDTIYGIRPVQGIVYEVDLVEMPGEGKGKLQGAPPAKERKGKAIIKKETRARRITIPKKKEKPLVIAKRTAEREKSPAKKPKKTSPSQLIDRAISRIKRKVKSENKSHIDKAISKLESKVGDRHGAGSGVGRGVSGIPIRLYQMEVENWIKSNWSYPVAIHSTSDLEAIVLVTVKRDGAILKTRLKKRSSSAVFDESVSKAIERSDPLPPFPEGYRKSHDEIEINFNLKDLQD